ncbi:hypothetical protein GCK32_018400, partial [Trichostrongylus colubriformis]
WACVASLLNLILGQLIKGGVRLDPTKEMTNFRFVVVFISIVVSAAAIKCYMQKLTGDAKPTVSTPCPLSTYCTKSVVESNGQTVKTYGCNSVLCSDTGCSSPTKGTTLCCCSTDLCNASSSFSLLFTIVPLILIKLIAF